jgi:hypothetical protein
MLTRGGWRQMRGSGFGFDRGVARMECGSGFQPSSVWRSEPRALPWAVMSRAFGPETKLRLMSQKFLAINGRVRHTHIAEKQVLHCVQDDKICGDFEIYVAPLEGLVCGLTEAG